MRNDALGLFWQDLPPVKKEKVDTKRIPPERVWEEPGYLPELDEPVLIPASAYLTDEELTKAVFGHEPFVFDIECYVNYFLIAFSHIASGKILTFELYDGQELNKPMMQWVMDNACIVGFNSKSYDMPMAAFALAGWATKDLKAASDDMIQQGIRPADIMRKWKVKKLISNHIDLIEVAPLRASLKIYSGRIHTRRMQDLPFHPGAELSPEQRDVTRWYCLNDLRGTAELRENLLEQLHLRDVMNKEYGTDLRSLSDAQIAENIIGREILRLNRQRPTRPVILAGTVYRYKAPPFLRYQSELMNWALNSVCNTEFIVSEKGSIGMPAEMKAMRIAIGGSVYRMGIGGLHSSETSAAYIEDADYILVDRDVVSYYPAIILNLGLYPDHLGMNFLAVYKQLVDKRLAAKAAGNKIAADSLKICINGSFGKLGSPYSILYAPNLLIQVTVTGQLSLLMLIERLELHSIPVVSANTDGIVIRCPRRLQSTMDSIVAQWEADTGFNTEETPYTAIYSRDVNNYMAVKPTGKIKAKGAFARGGLYKNPTNEICIEAIEALLTKDTPVDHTIRTCTDIRKFISVRTVKGGAVKDGIYLGKAIRWYYAQEVEGEIVYAASGNMVPRSTGARPVMLLPPTLPTDIDYEWYITETHAMLEKIGYILPNDVNNP